MDLSISQPSVNGCYNRYFVIFETRKHLPFWTVGRENIFLLIFCLVLNWCGLYAITVGNTCDGYEDIKVVATS